MSCLFPMMSRTVWKSQPWVGLMDTAEKVAKRWVNAIQQMEIHQEKLYIIRYEDMISNPQGSIEEL